MISFKEGTRFALSTISKDFYIIEIGAFSYCGYDDKIEFEARIYSEKYKKLPNRVRRVYLSIKELKAWIDSNEVLEVVRNPRFYASAFFADDQYASISTTNANNFLAFMNKYRNGSHLFCVTNNMPAETELPNWEPNGEKLGAV